MGQNSSFGGFILPLYLLRYEVTHLKPLHLYSHIFLLFALPFSLDLSYWTHKVIQFKLHQNTKISITSIACLLQGNKSEQ